MKLVIGGAYQGKRDWAEAAYHVADAWFCCREAAGLFPREQEAQPAVKEQGAGSPAACRRTVWQEPGACLRQFETALKTCKGIDGLQDLVRYYLEGLPVLPDAQEGEAQAEAFAASLQALCPDAVITCNELGCGIVPVERFDRTWRELTGRICIRLAKNSDEVVRVICGIGTSIK